MIPKNTSEFNKKIGDFQRNFNKGWKIGPITVILVIALLIFLIFSFLNIFNTW